MQQCHHDLQHPRPPRRVEATFRMVRLHAADIQRMEGATAPQVQERPHLGRLHLLNNSGADVEWLTSCFSHDDSAEFQLGLSEHGCADREVLRTVDSTERTMRLSRSGDPY